MDSYKRLLVVIDEHDFSFRGISRAAYMANKSRAHILVMLLEHSHFVTRLVETFHHSQASDPSNVGNLAQTISAKRHCLADFIQTVAQTGVAISPASTSCHCIDDVLQCCRDFQVDAVLISASTRQLWHWLAIKSLDVRLLKESPRPVVIVKDHAWQPGGRIVSLVEPCAEGGQKSINEAVLQTTEHFTQLLKGDCHLLDCYYGDSPSISFQQPVMPETDEQYHLCQLSLYSSRYHLLPNQSDRHVSASHFHVTKALPEDAIAKLAKQVDSELVIVGDCGQSNLLSNMCGNIAEQVIDRIDCDLLVVKPHSSAVYH